MFDIRLCPRCGRNHDTLGMGGECLEEPPAPPPPARPLDADEWEALHKARQRAAAEAGRSVPATVAGPSAQDLREQAACQEAFDLFMSRIQGGNDPWGKSPTVELRLPLGPRRVAERLCGLLKEKKFAAAPVNPLHTGPGGRGETQSEYRNPDEWVVHVYKPGIRPL